MPSNNFKRSKIPPANLEKLVPVTPDAAPPIPSLVADPNRPFRINSNLSSGPPTSISTNPDQLQNWVRPGLSQYRIFAPQPGTAPAVGAAGASQAAARVAPVAIAAAAAQTTANTALALAENNLFIGTWDNATLYQPGNQVTYGGSYYTCLLANTNEEPDLSPADWQLVSSPATEQYLGAWSAVTAYVAGNQVSLNGSYYICILANTNEQPPDTTYWTLVGTSAILLGTWSPSTAYVVGNQAVYNGNVYTCIVANTNQTPSTTSTYWTIVGSQSLSSIPPTGSISPIVSSPFSYTSTSSSITISWNSFSINLVDGTTINVTNGSQTITGLNASTTYSFFPYYNGSSIEFVTQSDVSGLISIAGVYLDGTAGQITTTNSFATSGLSDFSIECWVYFYSTGGGEIIESNSVKTGTPSTSSLGPGYAYGGSGSYTYLYNSTTEYVDALAPAISMWHHLVWTYPTSGSLSQFYIDGVAHSVTALTAPSSYTGYWRIGTGGFLSGPVYLHATLAHVAVYRGTVLTATQVANHYNAMTSTGPAAYASVVEGDSPTSYWKLDETSGTSAADSSSTGTNTGTYTGTPGTNYILNTSHTIGGASGSPAIAWQTPSPAVVLYQFQQANYPLSAGQIGFTASTTSSGNGGGLAGGWQIPGLPYGLNPLNV
jgi:Carbohydrate-binding module family 5/12